MKLMINQRFFSRAFTLIELLLVIGIIGLLVSAVTVSYRSIEKKSRDTRRREDLKWIQSQVESYKYVNATYPTTNNNWYGDGTFRSTVISNYINNLNPNTVCNGAACDINNYIIGRYYVPELYVGGYAQNLPIDPRYAPTNASTKQYAYRSNGLNYKALALDSVETGNVTYPDPMADPPQDGDPSTEVPRAIYSVYSDGAASW